MDSTTGLRLHNVVAEPAVLQGKKGVRIRHSEEALRRLEKISGEEQAQSPQLAAIRLPEPNVTAIVLANNESVNASAIGGDLLAIFYGEPYTAPRSAATPD